MKTPNLGDAHCGDGALQSQQTLFLDSFWIAASYTGERVSKFGACDCWERGAWWWWWWWHATSVLTLDRVSGSTSHIALEAMMPGQERREC